MKRRSHYPPPLFMHGKEPGQTDTIKFLGSIFDTRLTWQTRIKQLKVQCFRSLNVLKYLSNSRTGCHRRLPLRLYRTLIRSRLDHDDPSYGLANKSIPQTTALRIITGPFPLASVSVSAQKRLNLRFSIEELNQPWTSSLKYPQCLTCPYTNTYSTDP